MKRELASVVIFESHAKAGTVCESSICHRTHFSFWRVVFQSDTVGPLWEQAEAAEERFILMRRSELIPDKMFTAQHKKQKKVGFN